MFLNVTQTSLSCPSFVAISQQSKHFGKVPAVVVVPHFLSAI